MIASTLEVKWLCHPYEKKQDFHTATTKCNPAVETRLSHYRKRNYFLI
jgi:hypothetical protein